MMSDHAGRRKWLLGVLTLFAFSSVVSSMKVVEELPGFDGKLPFYLETGYIGVGDLDESQLFYYFVESQRTPSQDPIMLWLTGGPGCSVLSAFFYEQGPVEFNYGGYNGSLPTLHLNPYTWTQVASIIYVDAPIGTGFSYSTTAENYAMDDYKNSEQTYQFLRKFMASHPQYLDNILYIGGDSYSGIPLPMIVQKILDGNEAGLEPYLNIKGYVLGNPKTDDYINDNSRVPFSHKLTLLSDDLYEDAYTACGGDFVNYNASNDCATYIDEIDYMIQDINLMQILEPLCKTASSRPSESMKGVPRSMEVNYEGFLAAQSSPAFWCRDYNYVVANIWANNKEVRAALGVRTDTTSVWNRCNSSIDYTKTVPSTIGYHRNFSTTSELRALIYSGDHDLSVTHLGTQDWISTLGLTVYTDFRPWFVDGQIAGYTVEYISADYTLDYATLKGAGHVAPEYRPQQCYEMINRWFAYYPL